MKGAEPKCAVISDLPLIICAMASGWPSETVSESSLPPWPGPNAFSAAICRVIAWIDTRTAGRPMRSFSVKSLMLLTAGLMVLR